MQDSLIDITLSPERLVKDFRALHPFLDKFIASREDGLAIGNIQLIKFIVLCYDRYSRIALKNGDNWAERKKEAAVQAGLKSNHGWVEGTNQLLFGKNEIINSVIIRYLSIQFDKDFMMLAAMNEMLINATQELMDFKFSKPSDATKAKNNIDDLSKQLEILEDKVFSGGDIKELRKALDQHIQKYTVKDLRPENIVTKIENGEEIVDDKPYGDYVPEKQKFLNDH